MPSRHQVVRSSPVDRRTAARWPALFTLMLVSALGLPAVPAEEGQHHRRPENIREYLEHRPEYFKNMRSALKPGGRIAVIDFYHDERSGDVGFPRKHLVARETVVTEMSKAGYKLLREHTFLPRQYF